MLTNHKTIMTVILVCITAPVFIYFIKVPEATTNDELTNSSTATENFQINIESGLASRDQGKYAEAATFYEQASVVAPDPVTKALALRRAGVANYMTRDTSRQLKALEQLKESISIAPTAEETAAAIGNLAYLAATLCGSGCDMKIYNEIFKGELYEKYYFPDDKRHSINGLYTWSLDVYPTAVGYARVSAWYADQLLADPALLSDERRQQYVQAIEKYLTEAFKLSDYRHSSSRAQISFYTRAGYAYGALVVLGDKKYGPDFESAFETAIALGTASTVGTNDNYATLFAHFKYAALLDRMYGSARADDVRSNLDVVINSVNNDPNLENNQFLIMAESEISEGNFEYSFTSQSLVSLMEKYPPFKYFLTSHDVITVTSKE